MTFEKTKVVQNIQTFRPISTGIHVVATTTLVSIWPSDAQIVCEDPLVAIVRAEEEQNNVEWIPKLNAHAQNLLGSIQHTKNLCVRWRLRLW